MFGSGLATRPSNQVAKQEADNIVGHYRHADVCHNEYQRRSSYGILGPLGFRSLLVMIDCVGLAHRNNVSIPVFGNHYAARAARARFRARFQNVWFDAGLTMQTITLLIFIATSDCVQPVHPDVSWTGPLN